MKLRRIAPEILLLFALIFGHAHTVTAQNPGFENISGRTNWNNFSIGGWTYDNNYSEIGEATPWGNPSFIRGGDRGIEIIPSSSTSYNEWRLGNYSVTTPGSGSYYVHVIGHHIQQSAGGCVAAAGIFSGSYNFGSDISPATSFGSFTHTIAATNNTTYYPAFRTKKQSTGTGKAGFEDFIIYYDNQSTADLTAPGAASSVSASLSGTQCTLSFSEGADNSGGSGVDGYLILRATGAAVTTPTVLPQVMYHPSTASIGPTTLTVASPYEQWQVVYNGAATSGNITNSVASATSYTYLIYMRDKAYNYSTPVRVLVVNSSIGVNSNMSVDGLLLAGGQLAVNSGIDLSFNNGASYVNTGGSLLNNGTVTIPDGTDLTISGSFQNGNGSLNIKNGGYLTMDGTLDNLWSTSKVVVENGGSFTLGNSGELNNEQGVFNIENGGTALINGTLNNKTSVNVSSSGSLTFGETGTYMHLREAGTIPTATWNDGSTCELKGETWWSDEVPAGLGQSFSNFTWDWPFQGTNLDLDGVLTTVTGTFKLENTNGNNLILDGSNNSSTQFNFGNVEISGGNLVVAQGAHADNTLNVAGNFEVSGGSFTASTGNNSDVTINVGQTVLVSGGSVVSSSATNPGLTKWNLEGSLIVDSPGNFTTHSDTTKSFSGYNTEINFTNTSGNDSTSYLKLPGGLNYDSESLWRISVSGGRTINLLSDVELGGSSNVNYTSFTVDSGATVNLGTYQIGNSTNASNTAFILNSGGKLGIGDENGISQSPANTGNILTSSRSYNAQADYVYTGSASQQLGNGFPGKVRQLILNNPHGMTLQEDVEVDDTLKLLSGTLRIGNHTLTIKHGLQKTNGAMVGGPNSSIVVDNANGPAIELPSVELKYLKVNRKAGIILSGGLEIHDSLTLEEGILDTDTHCITLKQNGRLKETKNSYIKGCVTTTRNLSSLLTTYDCGNIGLVLIFNGVAPGSTEVTRITGKANTKGSKKSIKRIYGIHTSVNTGLDATIQFSYFDSELNGIDEENLVLFRSPDGGESWINRGVTTRDTLNNLLTLANIDGFSDWTGGDNLDPLPVELVSLNVKALGNDAVLNWSTASEINNDRFEVQRSLDGTNWQIAGTVTGNGNSNYLIHYSYTDAEALSLPGPVLYYRLKQIDYNGTYEYSHTVALRKENLLKVQNAWYNAGTGTIQLSLNGSANAYAQVLLYDLQGREVARSGEKLPQGESLLQIPVRTLTEGVYIIKVNTGAEVISRKIVIRK